MQQEIIEHLAGLEASKNIKILMAVESGSRAWGCPSPDSDYDVRIIYCHPVDHYLSINSPKEHIDYFHGKLLDINGWDLRKTFQLIRKSNATPFEWAQSPMVYQEVDQSRSTILDLARHYFNPYHTLNHYKGIAHNSFQKGLQGDQIKLKKLFYVLRPILAAQWIIENRSIPPMDIPTLLPILQDAAVTDRINELIDIKKDLNEDYVHRIEPSLIQFIETAFNNIKRYNFENSPPTQTSALLNQKFREIIRSYSS